MLVNIHFQKRPLQFTILQVRSSIITIIIKRSKSILKMSPLIETNRKGPTITKFCATQCIGIEHTPVICGLILLVYRSAPDRTE